MQPSPKPLLDTPVVPADPAHACPRAVTDLFRWSEYLFTCMRSGRIEDALQEIDALCAKTENGLAAHEYPGLYIGPNVSEANLSNFAIVLEALPPLVRARRFAEAEALLVRETTTRNESDVKAAYKAAMAERRQQEATP
jgi:hypothetical protein